MEIDTFFYLVTKKRYFDLPTYSDLESSLLCMREFCLAKRVKNIALPKIGCGLDRLQWSQVSAILNRVFKHTDIEITVYVL